MPRFNPILIISVAKLLLPLYNLGSNYNKTYVRILHSEEHVSGSFEQEKMAICYALVILIIMSSWR